MLRRTVALVLLLLVTTVTAAQEAIKVEKEHLVHNSDKDGVCWFCCASMIGNHAGILPLQGLDQKVLKSGIGHKGGASEWSIKYWLKQGGVTALENHEGNKGRDGVSKLQEWLDRGLPVIASYRHSSGAHAILLTRISRTKEKWTPFRRAEIHDYSVSYVDPDDDPADMRVRRVSWTWFHSVWTGRAYAFDPKAQDSRIVRKPPLRPSRLLMAAAPPLRKMVDPALLERTKHVSPPIEARYEAPPYLPHELPYEARYPAYYEKVKIPSNQDLKDGVTRPLDHFTDNCYGYFEHNYHAEYEAHKAKKAKP